jgi:biopolymer transport protein ExbD
MPRKHRRRKRPKIFLPMASMGDIAFLLIIFFLLASNFLRDASLQLDPPRAENLDSLEDTPITVAIDREGVIHLQGVRIDNADAIEGAIAGLIEGRTTARQKTVLFRCDAAAGRDLYEPVLEAITRSGALLAVVGEKRDSPASTVRPNPAAP